MVLAADADSVYACDDRPLLCCLQEVSSPLGRWPAAVHSRRGGQPHCGGLQQGTLIV